MVERGTGGYPTSSVVEQELYKSFIFGEFVESSSGAYSGLLSGVDRTLTMVNLYTSSNIKGVLIKFDL